MKNRILKTLVDDELYMVSEEKDQCNVGAAGYRALDHYEADLKQIKKQLEGVKKNVKRRK